MPTLQVTGRACTTKKFTADTNGETISFTVPVKSFLIKAVGGTVNFKFQASDLNADAFPIFDGETVGVDLSLAFPIATNTATVGVVFTSAGTVDVYVLAAF